METLTLNIMEESVQSKMLIEYIKVLPFVELSYTKEKEPNATTLRAMQEIKENKVIRAKSAKKLLEKLKK